MDKFDQAIIAALKQDARQSMSALAQQVNLSRSAVTDRLKKLEQSGVIRGYQVLLSESQKTGVAAYFEVHHRSRRCKDLVTLFNQFPEIITCHGISGEMDFLVHLKADSMQRLHEIREQIDAHDDVTRIRTHIVMSEWINGRCG
ncbi:Lrp/AsnC family transcriptional regulator [Shewanella corallii]|uniref:Lrp/AsnC family transcriptional regulator n=2 Tax=Shewanella TaxID=22 RepID=A0ABT0NBR4_9GAMM|nr:MULTISPECIES: Lrp/AsnC family transcriptional regulator [Shewanella]MCL1038931.1 Lrp/AsnC family transcriptional regulator [Shewanella submarina]MCL2915247.1 Lrp/AsnC family transcriptional regulator [Shewanella corallii]